LFLLTSHEGGGGGEWLIKGQGGGVVLAFRWGITKEEIMFWNWVSGVVLSLGTLEISNEEGALILIAILILWLFGMIKRSLSR